MWPRRQADPELLDLFEESGRNVARRPCCCATCWRNIPSAPSSPREIFACEHEGDRIAHEILRRLAEHGAGRGALDAADVHALAGALDDIVDYAEEAADQLGLYGVEAPMEQAAGDGRRARRRRRAGRRGAARRCATGWTSAPHLVEIHRLENEADQIVRARSRRCSRRASTR